MTPLRCRLLCVCLALLAAAPAAAEAQESDPEQPLQGPAVPDDVARTLVGRGMTGEFQRVEGRPEAAAVALLNLDAAARQRVEDVLDDRAMSVALLLVDHIDDVREITEALAAGEGERARELLRAMWDHLDPGRPRDPLLTPLAEALTPEQLAEVARLTDEYWQALLRWELRSRDDLGGDARLAAEREVLERLAFQLFQEEVRQAYDATLRRYRDVLQGIEDAVEPTDEQRAAMRDIVIDHIRETGIAATPAQRRAATLEIYRLLDDERRERLFDYLLRQIVPDQ